MSKLETKRFVIRKSLIGKNTIITTKSNIVKVYTFKAIKQNNEYYNSITNSQM